MSLFYLWLDANLAAVHAKKQADDAADIIQNLNYELRGLKRKLNSFQTPDIKVSSGLGIVTFETDSEIDEMMARPMSTFQPKAGPIIDNPTNYNNSHNNNHSN